MGKPKFSVGQTVRVKTLEELKRTARIDNDSLLMDDGTLLFSKEMFECCGKRYTIKEVISLPGNILLPRYILGSVTYFFSEDCLKSVGSKLKNAVGGENYEL